MTATTNKMCQSCGIPLKKDPLGGGSEKDGSRSSTYCGYCYENGEFKFKGTDVKEFQEHSRKMMIEGGHNKFFAWLFSRGLKRLDRWKN